MRRSGMPGLFAGDIMGFLVSLVRIVARKGRARRCIGWRETTATIVGVSWRAQLTFPRPEAEIAYTYRIDGGFYGGVIQSLSVSKAQRRTMPAAVPRETV